MAVEIKTGNKGTPRWLRIIAVALRAGLFVGIAYGICSIPALMSLVRDMPVVGDVWWFDDEFYTTLAIPPLLAIATTLATGISLLAVPRDSELPAVAIPSWAELRACFAVTRSRRIFLAAAWIAILFTAVLVLVRSTMRASGWAWKYAMPEFSLISWVMFWFLLAALTAQSVRQQKYTEIPVNLMMLLVSLVDANRVFGQFSAGYTI